MEKIGRNDLCPCGSGKKHKKCCGKNNVISMEHMIEKDIKDIQVDIIHFALNHYEEEMNDLLEERIEEFDIPDEGLEMFRFFSLTWFITSIEVKGKTILAHYIDKNLGKWKRQSLKSIIQSWKEARPAIAIIQDQDSDQLLTVQDIFTDEIHKVKALEEDHPVETGGAVLGIFLPSGNTSYFFTTFVDFPKSFADNVKQRVVTLFEESKETSPSEYVSENYPEVLYQLMFETKLALEELDWHSPKHLEVAMEFKEYMDGLQDEVIIELGLHLWHQYCLRKNPKIMKPNVYTAALIYLVDQFNPFGDMLTQKELAEEFETSSSTISAKYKEMERVLSEEIQELKENLDSIDFDEVFDDMLFDDDDDDDLFFEDDDEEDLFSNDNQLFTDKDEKIFTNSRVRMERELLQLEAEMKDHQFNSLEDVNQFMTQRLNNNEVQQNKLTNKEKAQELLFDAFEASGNKRLQLAYAALKVYPNSSDAYTILAEHEMNPVKEEELLLKAIEAGEKELGQEFFKENKGHFWGIVSTRPYMRAKYNYAVFLQDIGKTEAAIKHYEELLELNPSDNQGVRYELFTALLEKSQLKKAEELLYRFNEDVTANGTYNMVLIEFLQNGASSKAKKLLQIAKKQNPYVPDYLLEKKVIPLYLPGSYQLGDEAEAVIYADQHLDIWNSNRKLMDWLKKNK